MYTPSHFAEGSREVLHGLILAKPEDRLAAIQAMATSGDPESAAVADLMRETFLPPRD